MFSIKPGIWPTILSQLFALFRSIRETLLQTVLALVELTAYRCRQAYLAALNDICSIIAGKLSDGFEVVTC